MSSITMLSISVAEWVITLLGLVIFGYSVILYIMLINSSVVLCVFGFNKSVFKSPQINIDSVYDCSLKMFFSIQILKVSTLVAGVLYMQLIRFLYFLYRFSVIYLCSLSTMPNMSHFKLQCFVNIQCNTSLVFIEIYQYYFTICRPCALDLPVSLGIMLSWLCPRCV